MPHFIATTYVNVNGRPLTYVDGVKAAHNSTYIGATCEIKVPLQSIIRYDGTGGKRPTVVTTLNEVPIAIGDPITVMTQYDGYPEIIKFSGFVYDFVEDMPLTIKCMDYMYFLNITWFGMGKQSLAFPGNSNLQQVVEAIINGVKEQTGQQIILTPGNVIPNIYQFVNLSYTNMSATAILDKLRKGLGINITLFGNQLYVNIASNTTATVPLDTRYNVKKSGLQKPDTAFQLYQITAIYTLPNGKKGRIQAGSGINHDIHLTGQVYNPDNFQQQAQNALTQQKLRHFEGKVTTYLYPDIPLYASVPYNDFRYPDKNGTYICMGTEFATSDHGYENTYMLAFPSLSSILTTA